MAHTGSGRTRVPEVNGGAKKAEEAMDEEGEREEEETASTQPPPLILDVGMKLVDPTETVPGTNRVEWRAAMRDVVLPRLARFKPDLILISAGFDAHKKDCINMGYIGKNRILFPSRPSPLLFIPLLDICLTTPFVTTTAPQTGLVEEDYEWITRQLIRVANTFCHGRVVSVLEGGYRIQGGLVSAFARSVAAHVSRRYFSAAKGVLLLSIL